MKAKQQQHTHLIWRENAKWFESNQLVALFSKYIIITLNFICLTHSKKFIWETLSALAWQSIPMA